MERSLYNITSTSLMCMCDCQLHVKLVTLNVTYFMFTLHHFVL